MSGLTYTWVERWVTSLKQDRFLAPSSIRQRVQALSRGFDWYLRSNPTTKFVNPIRLLPRGYSVYTDQDAKVINLKGEKSRIDVVRDRRLLAGEADKIRAVLRGEKLPTVVGKGVPLNDGKAMLVLFEVIMHTGMRLREAYMLRKENIDFKTGVIRLLTTKQRNGKIVYREVPIRPEIYDILKGYATPEPGLLFPFWNGDDAQLTHVTNRLSHRFANVFLAAPCDSLVEHDLRHEATCQWFELRDDRGNWLFRPEEINKIMGWAPGSTMAARYASFRAASLAERLWQRVGVSLQGSVLPDH
jgi:integrase